MRFETPELIVGGITLRGRAFLAPLAAYTSWPFRRICRSYGAALVTTEVVKAREVVRRIAPTLEHIGYKPDEHPIAAQFMSADPDEAGEAVRVINEMGFDFVDLNLGCPKRRVLADGLGGALMESPGKVEKVVAQMCRCSTTPVTVKMRSGRWKDQITAVEMAQRCEAAGAAAVCVHPRFAQGCASLPPDWRVIASVKQAVRIPVIGNGGVRTPADALRMFEETGCDAVALGAAAIGRPWIFHQINELLVSGVVPPLPTHEEILQTLLDHYEGLLAHHGERRGTVMMRKQSCHYAKHLRNGKAFNRAVIHASTRAEVMAAVDEWLREPRGPEGA